MPSAEILTIGTELLLGEIVDTNSRYISRTLRDHNVDIFWLSTVGDNAHRIAEAIKLGLQRSEIIVTTGGLGPTIDDPTREAAALALGVETEFRPELWQQVQDRFARFGRTPTENNKRQAYVPAGAIAIENPVGTAPAFIGETEKNALICLPGVPREMEYLMTNAVIPYLKDRFDLKGIIKARILRTAGGGESAIDELIADLETLSNPTVGLAAHAGSVDVRITAKAGSQQEADDLIGPVEEDLRQRLGGWIYGADSDTLEGVALAHLDEIGWNLAVVEAGLGGKLTQRLANTAHPAFLGGEVLAETPNPAQLMAACQRFRETRQADLCIGIALHRGEEKQNLYLSVISPIKERSTSRSYGGPPKMAGQWAVNTALDLIRRLEGA
ncbi:MAG: CinA family nicotinamide mononucleotide deamidase-related protein [Anaerolineales bacterium]